MPDDSNQNYRTSEQELASSPDQASSSQANGKASELKSSQAPSGDEVRLDVDQNNTHASDGKTASTTGILQLTLAEVDTLSTFAKYVDGNPRKLKRITSSYVMARALNLDGDVSQASVDDWLTQPFCTKLALWVFMCEEWPMRVSWILLRVKLLLEAKRTRLQ